MDPDRHHNLFTPESNHPLRVRTDAPFARPRVVPMALFYARQQKSDQLLRYLISASTNAAKVLQQKKDAKQ